MGIRKKIRVYRMFWTLYRKWRQFKVKIRGNRSKAESLVIVPCDPESIGGSRGDEAMIVATIQFYTSLNPTLPIYIVSADNAGNEYISSLPYTNIKPLKCWYGAYPLEKLYNTILSVQPKDVCILGADCMDGFYSPYISLMLLAIHDLFSQTQNVKSHLLAFSFNASPSWMMRYAFKKVNKQLAINLRDYVSHTRYEKMVGNAGVLADAAFSLQYDEHFAGYDRMKEWCSKQRKECKKIVAFNLHPMLRQYNYSEEIVDDAKKVTKNLAVMMHRYKSVAIVLLPHDARKRISDNNMLSIVYDELKNEYADRLYYDAKVYHAAQLKGMCGLFDALISSRMHLAIAALGREVPVMAATYQGKFEGLFQHFGLSEEYLMAPLAFCTDEFQYVLDKFFDNHNELHNIIKEALPKVLTLSKKNFQ